MSARHIIAVAAADRGKPGLVIEVKQTGSNPLDVRLAATEGENPYVTTLKQRDIGQLKNKATDEEWETVVSHFLLQEQPERANASILRDVTMEYYLHKGGNVHVMFKRDIQGIRQTLGELRLSQDEDQELDPVEWAYVSAQAHNESLKQLIELKQRLGSEQDTIDKLNAQLEDFIKTKNETETAMLQQFMDLLNEKKRKIRDQSRLLAGAKVDQSVATAVQSARDETKPRKAGPSRRSKRKAGASRVADLKEESDEDQMEIDESKAEEQNNVSEPEAATPDRSDDEETEDEDGPPPSRVQQKGKGKASALGNASATGSQASKSGASKNRSPPPPRRELPFLRNKAAQKQSAPPAEEDDDETEDEL